MPEEPSKLKIVTDLLDRYGVTLATAIFLGWVLVYKLDHMQWQLDRILRNTRSLQQHFKIPMIMDGENPK